MDKTLDLDEAIKRLTVFADECETLLAADLRTLIAAARPAVTRDWSEFEDEISDAISDSIDMDWSARDGAKAVVALLNKVTPQ